MDIRGGDEAWEVIVPLDMAHMDFGGLGLDDPACQGLDSARVGGESGVAAGAFCHRNQIGFREHDGFPDRVVSNLDRRLCDSFFCSPVKIFEDQAQAQSKPAYFPQTRDHQAPGLSLPHLNLLSEGFQLGGGCLC